jgi:hypothetical protein
MVEKCFPFSKIVGIWGNEEQVKHGEKLNYTVRRRELTTNLHSKNLKIKFESMVSNGE